MERFHHVYQTSKYNDLQLVLLSGPAHHRLTWIHPFLDGNGRITRLFSDSYFTIAKVDGYGLWSISRGLARHRQDYFSALQAADSTRQGDLDGRGNLSQRGLIQFTEFFLKCAIDQIDFMAEMLNLDQMQHRIKAYCEYQSNLGILNPESAAILCEVLIHGKIARGLIPGIINKPERTARRITKQLIELRLLRSATEKGPLELAIPANVIGYYFPNLYPQNIVSIHHF